MNSSINSLSMCGKPGLTTEAKKSGKGQFGEEQSKGLLEHWPKETGVG